MEILLQQVINGLVLGSIYALIALGYTMVYGILSMINFAHGDVLMIGAMSAYAVISGLHSVAPATPGPILLGAGLLAAIPICVSINIIIERVAYRPLRNAPRLAPLITAIGISIILQTLAMIIFGRDYKVFPTMLPAQPISFGGASITPAQILILFTTTATMAGLVIMVEKTRFGRAMRATAESPRLASLMGVNANSIIVATFAIGAGLAAVAGVLWVANYSIAHFYMGFLPGLKAFTAAVLGGIGNLYGAMIGGLLLGVIESLSAGYLSQMTGGFLNSSYQDVIAFVVLIAVLTLRPSGLLGERIADRA